MNNICWEHKNQHFTAIRMGPQSLTKDHMVFMSDARLQLGTPGVPYSQNILRNCYKACLKQLRTFLVTLI